ncbi:AAEL006994-PA [Aedes aegypti]|uniref:AAEL006994-PA n=1 Tax=Aedes aegypti TaxID=7159 RepID=Q173W6_AEDAE|nr:AAEL006994-PA [Aedes aegypti]
MVNADQAYEQHMQEKRKRLAALLQAEEMQQQAEVIEKLREQEIERLRAKENALLAVKQDKERQREEFIKNKMIQLKLNNCDEIRTLVQQKYHEEAKRCQLAQIEDKKKLKLAQLDEERLWKEVHMRNYKLKLDRELNDKRKRVSMECQTLLDIKDQMKERTLRLEKEKVEQQEARCTSLPFPEGDPKLIQMKKSDLAEKLKEQMATNIMLQRKRADQERDLVKVFNEGMEQELAREKATRDAEKQTLKKQIDQYYKYSKHIEKQRSVDEAKIDKLINDVRQQYDKKEVENCNETLKKRWGLADSVYETQRMQIAEMEKLRRKQEEDKILEGARERQLYENHLQKSIEANQRMQTAVKKYRETLKEQIKSATLERERCKRHDQTQTNRLVEANIKDLDFVQSYVKGSFESHFKKHPNTALMRKKY